MLKIDFDKERGRGFAEASGPVADVATDFLYAVTSVYQTIREHDPMTAAMFRTFVQVGVMDATIWEEERHAKTRIFAPCLEKDGKGGLIPAAGADSRGNFRRRT